MPRDGKLETAVTLFLAEQAPELARAHDELYPERVGEHIPLSLTLLYPFAPRDELNESHLEKLRDFFASRPPLSFDLARVTQWEAAAPYTAPPPRPSGSRGQVERERGPRGEEVPQLLEVALVELGARRKRVEERERERDVLRDSLGIELVVGPRELGRLLREEQRDRGLELAVAGHQP